jgi:hypothetical protein
MVARAIDAGGVAVASTLPRSAVDAEANLVDAELIALGQQLETCRAALDHASDRR